jgi:predicted aspartyl protease
MTTKQNVIISALNQLNQAQLDLEIFAESKENKILVTALIDTGFEGDIALPLFIAEKLNLKIDRFKKIDLELAIGDAIAFSSNEIIFVDNRPFSVEIVWSDDMIEGLIGVGFFSRYTRYLDLNYNKKILEVKFNQL